MDRCLFVISRDPRARRGFRRELLVACVCLLLMPLSGRGCSVDLLQIIRVAGPVANPAAGLLELARRVGDMSTAMQTMVAARASLRLVISAWDAIDETTGPRLQPSTLVAPEPMGALIASLQEEVGRGNLFGAHERVRKIFYHSLALVPSESLRPDLSRLLDITLLLYQLQEFSAARNLSAMPPLLGRLPPLLEPLPGLFPDVATAAVKTMADLAQALEMQIRSPPPVDEDRALMAIALLRTEHEQILRSLAASLALSQTSQVGYEGGSPKTRPSKVREHPTEVVAP